MAHPQISVVIPTHNRSRYLGNAIESVLKQTYQNFEIIMVDDCSTDNTQEVVSDFIKKDKRIRYIRHKRNRGGGASRNTGIKAARGEFVAFLDDDDEWLEQKLERSSEIFSGDNDQLGVVYTGYFKVEAKTQKVLDTIYPELEGWVYKDLLYRNAIAAGGSSCLVKRKCFEAVGMFDENIPTSCEDWEMWIRIAKKFKFRSVKEPLVKCKHHQNRVTHNPQGQIVGRKRLYKAIAADLERYPKIKAHFHFDFGLLYCQFNYMHLGRKSFARAMAIDPSKLRYRLAYLLAFLGNQGFNLVYSTYCRIS